MFDYKLMSENVKEMNMTQLTHNQFFIKDGEAWYRDYDREISCRNLVREIALNLGFWKNDDPEMTDQETFDEIMYENLQYGTSDPEGVLAMYYSAMWGMAEVRTWYIEEKAKNNTREEENTSVIEMIDYDGEPVPKELCSIDREGGADDFYGCGTCFECENSCDCRECVIDKIFKHYAELTGQI